MTVDPRSISFPVRVKLAWWVKPTIRVARLVDSVRLAEWAANRGALWRIASGPWKRLNPGIRITREVTK